MTDLDLEHLGDVWRQRPDPAELAHLRQTAETVRRRARWAHMIDIVAAVLVSAVVLLLVASNPEVDTMIVGGAAILVLLGGQIRSRRLRLEELRSLTGSTEEMLDQSIARTEATLKRTRFQLLGLAPGFAIGLALAYLADDNAARLLPAQSLSGGWKTGLLIAGALAAVAMALYLVRSLRAGRKELERLLSLRQSYREEQESSDG